MPTYITGDTHGNLERIEKFSKTFSLTVQDIFVILGDVGLNFFNLPSQKEYKKRCNSFGPTILCIHGNHEERPYNIVTYKQKEWNGGLVYYEDEYPNILFAKDGEIYEIDNKKCIALGGAYSVDKWYRIFKYYCRNYPFLSQDLRFDDEEFEELCQFINGKNSDKNRKIRNKLEKIYFCISPWDCGWFFSEQPTDEIKIYAEKQLTKQKVDIIFSHTCPQNTFQPKCFWDA